MSRAPFLPGDIRWEVQEDARKAIKALPQEVHDNYASLRRGLQDLVCDYINAQEQCIHKGLNIAPVDAGVPGGKGLKVRFAIPGRGKSGSLRIRMVAFCDERRVAIAGLELRRDA